MSSSEELELSDDVDFPPTDGIPAIQFKQHLQKLQEKDFDESTGLELEFQKLENKSVRNGLFEEFQTASESVNRTKNRYANVLPPEKTRVKLRKEGFSSDYINANYIGGRNGPRTYIASQGPLKHTVNDFWRMIWEEKCDVVVMLTRVRENGRHKCHEYWPTEGDTYEDYSVSLASVDGDEALVERTFIMKDNKTQEERSITHFQYAEWPDHGLPTCTLKFREMLRKVDALHKLDSPILVHCSAGIGRTGTFCSVHITLHDLAEKGIENCTINLPETVLRLRKERTGMVQTRVQYEFCYVAILEEIENMKNTESAGDSKYCNFSSS